MCFIFFFFFNDTATTEIYTLSLHDALPISADAAAHAGDRVVARVPRVRHRDRRPAPRVAEPELPRAVQEVRSEEHTSELQSHVNLVCRLLLEKKKKKKIKKQTQQYRMNTYR